MQLLWLFFILSNLFYVFFFDENVFYFILFSILFLPNFFNVKFYVSQISLFQYSNYLRTNLNGLIFFFESTKNSIKNYILVLFSKINNFFSCYHYQELNFLFRFLFQNVVVRLEKKYLNNNLILIDFFFLLFLKNPVNFITVSDKKKSIANATLFLNTAKTQEPFVNSTSLSLLISHYKYINNNTSTFNNKK